MKTLPTLILSIALSVTASAAEKKQPNNLTDTVTLLSLEPAEVEYGMYRVEGDKIVSEEPNKLNFDIWYASGFWPEGRKIIEKVDPGASLPEGKPYVSAEHLDFFAVGGEFKNGVGLWARRPYSYHWMEYDIPTGAKTFVAQLLVTDDPFGYSRGYYPTASQQFSFSVDIDGKEVEMKYHERMNLEQGAGTDLDAINVPIPAGAKKIRLWVRNGSWNDRSNLNTELVLFDAKFLK